VSVTTLSNCPQGLSGPTWGLFGAGDSSSRAPSGLLVPAGGHILLGSDRRTLPLTGVAAVDLFITDLAVSTCDRHGGSGLTLIELAPDVTLDNVRDKTAAPLALGPTLAGDTQ
jgi:hypothetical protein